MAILKVARLGHPVLRKVAAPVPVSEIRSAETQRLIDDMIETMREYNGAGLAAPQVRACAEAAARAREDDGSYGGVGGGVRKKLDEAFSLVRGDGVERFGAVEGDPRDLIVSGVQYQ